MCPVHDGTQATYSVGDANETYSGIYSVVVSNGVGAVLSASASLTVIKSPSPDSSVI